MSDVARPPTVGDLLDMSVRAETQGLNFYARMAEAFVDQPEVAAIWQSLHEDEALHLAGLQRLAGRLEDQGRAEPVSEAQARRARDILGILVERRINRIEDLQDAYDLAKEYECSELNRLFTFLMTTAFDFQAKRIALHHELGEHQAKLERIRQLVCSVEARRAIRPRAPAVSG